MSLYSDLRKDDYIEELSISMSDFDEILPSKTPNFFNFKSASIGNGTFGSYTPKKGVWIFYASLFPEKDVVWNSAIIEDGKDTLFFNYILNAPEGMRSYVEIPEAEETLSSKTLLIDATKSSRKSLKLPGKKKFEILQIALSEEIFSDYMMELIPQTTDEIKKYIQSHFYKKNQTGLMLPLDIKEERCIREIIHCPTKAELQRFFTLLKISELMMCYFSRIVNRDISSIISHDKISLTDKVKIVKIKKHVDENIDKELNVVFYSSMYEMPAVQINQLFRNVFGYTLSKYHRKKKLNEAYSLLLDTGNKMTVKEITFSLGFSSITSFSRSFYNEFKIRPSDINVKIRDLDAFMHQTEESAND
ncbi:MAG: helix-turn-helix domain-containing protein [Paludibacteraceae bacterium]